MFACRGLIFRDDDNDESEIVLAKVFLRANLIVGSVSKANTDELSQLRTVRQSMPQRVCIYVCASPCHKLIPRGISVSRTSLKCSSESASRFYNAWAIIGPSVYLSQRANRVARGD